VVCVQLQQGDIECSASDGQYKYQSVCPVVRPVVGQAVSLRCPSDRFPSASHDARSVAVICGRTFGWLRDATRLGRLRLSRPRSIQVPPALPLPPSRRCLQRRVENFISLHGCRPVSPQKPTTTLTEVAARGGSGLCWPTVGHLLPGGSGLDEGVGCG